MDPRADRDLRQERREDRGGEDDEDGVIAQQLLAAHHAPSHASGSRRIRGPSNRHANRARSLSRELGARKWAPICPRCRRGRAWRRADRAAAAADPPLPAGRGEAARDAEEGHEADRPGEGREAEARQRDQREDRADPRSRAAENSRARRRRSSELGPFVRLEHHRLREELGVEERSHGRGLVGCRCGRSQPQALVRPCRPTRSRTCGAPRRAGSCGCARGAALR